MKKVIWLLVAVVAAGAGYYFYQSYREAERNGNAHLVSGNGRLEATEVSIATKLAGRIETIMVNEGDFVTEGQKLALMQTNVLEAQLEQAKAQRRQAVTAEASAKAMVEVRVSELEAAKAGVL
ncbi:MAG: biotin/lipoyl-binding protein, partial [Victivallis vadensis]